MKRSIASRLGGAFVVGGCIAVCMQVIMMVVSMVVPVAELVPPVSLLVLGLVGMVLVLSGRYQQLNEIGGFGAGIMFCGLVDAVAGVFVGATMKARGDVSAGYRATATFALSVLGTIVVVGTVLGVVLAHTPGVLASMVPGPATPGPIIFLWAFLMGGLISIEGQVLLEFTPLPLTAVILVNAAIGMVLALLGVSTWLEALTGAGLCATVVDAGASAVLGGATFVLAGTPMRAIVFVLVMVLVVIMGIICGNILVRRKR